MKFRQLVAKHFLKEKSLKKVEKLDRRAITFPSMFRLLNFKRILAKLLPSGEYNTIGARYVMIGLN